MPSKGAKSSKKIVAVALTAAMCLGLSMTAFAAKETTWTKDELWSPNALLNLGPDYGVEPATYSSAKDAKGHAVDISWRRLSEGQLADVETQEKVADIFKDNGYVVPDKADFVPIMTGNITFDEGVPAGGGTVTFQLADLGPQSEGVRAGETVYLMQETAPGSGVWEVFAATVGQDLDVVVTLPRNGALVMVKVLADNTVITLDRTTGEVVDRKPADNVANNNAGKGTSTNASGATSPKTGEF